MPSCFHPPISQSKTYIRSASELGTFDLDILQRFTVSERYTPPSLAIGAVLHTFYFGTATSNYFGGYQSSVDSTWNAKHTVKTMDIDLDYEQRGRLELVAIHAGKPVTQLLIEAAEFLIDQDPSCFAPNPPHTQTFLSDAEMEARFTRILRL